VTARPRIALILGAAALGAFGGGIFNVANDLVAVVVLGASSAQIGLLNALESGAYLLLSVPAGWLLDRLNRQRSLLWTEALASLALTTVPLLWISGVLAFWHLALVSVLVGTCGMVWGLGITTVLASSTIKEQAASTQARRKSVETGAELVAPGATGALLTVVAAPIALFLAAIFRLAAGIALYISGRQSRHGRNGEPERRERSHFFPGIRRGFSFAVSTPPIFLATTTNAVQNASLALFSAVEVVYLVDVLDFTPAVIGLQAMVVAASALVGSVAAAWLLGRFPPLRTSCVAAFIGALSSILFPLTALDTSSLAYCLGLVIAFNVVWNFTAVIASAGRFGVVAALTPTDMMGRVQSFNLLVSMGPVPLFGLVGGWLGVSIGLGATLWVFTGLAALAAACSVLLLVKARAWAGPRRPS
jgi:hypothetical protein